MKKMHVLALSTTVVLALMSTSAFAARVAPPIPGNPHGDSSCQVLCDSDTPDDPKNPGNPDKPGMTEAQAAFQVCGDKLAALRKVTPNRIKAIDAKDSVKIIPVCESRSLAGSDDGQELVGRGNAAGLVGLIGRNALLVGALQKSRHSANDVVGVIVDHTNVTLYVHKH